MPNIVDSLPKSTRGRSRKYDFVELYGQLAESGKAAELVHGDDFECSGASMRQYLYRDAPEHGFTVKVRTRTEDDGTEDGRDIVTFATAKMTPKEKAEWTAKQNGENKSEAKASDKK
jgi:hypothetical protein